jgi:hypothetical protein
MSPSSSWSKNKPSKKPHSKQREHILRGMYCVVERLLAAQQWPYYMQIIVK